MKSIITLATILLTQSAFTQVLESAVFLPGEVPATMSHDNCTIAAKPNQYLPLTLSEDNKKELTKKGYIVQDQYLTDLNAGKGTFSLDVQSSQLYLSIEQMGRSSSSSSGNSVQIIYGFGSAIHPGITVEIFKLAVQNKKEKKIQGIAIESLPTCTLKTQSEL